MAKNGNGTVVEESKPTGNGTHVAMGKVSIFDTFETDPVKENEGVERQLDGYSFWVRRAGCPQHEAVLNSLGEAKRRAYQSGELPLKESQKITARVAGEALMSGWDTRFSEPYTPEGGYELCRRARHVADWVISQAVDYRNFLNQDREADAKN